MKKISIKLYQAILCSTLFVLGCNTKTTTTTFGSYSITPVTPPTTLPTLQAYALGVDSAGNWIIIGGRHNGLHNFSAPAFPDSLANKFIYKINPQTWSVDSFSLLNIWSKVNAIDKKYLISTQFTSTNIQHTQSGNYLYLYGGYGALPLSNILGSYSYVTNTVFSRVDLNKISTAISSKNTNLLLESIAVDTCASLQVTGGEMFRLADNNFYLVVGHNFNGEYGNAISDSGVQPTQNYVRRIWTFSLTETDSTIQINRNSLVSTPSVPLADSVSVLRRRDLVVVPSITSNNQVGLSIYGGVFTYTNSISNPGNPWNYPVYITGGNTPAYVVDSSFFQKSNLYAAANALFYSPSTQTMYTSIFGGLVDKDLDSNSASGGNPASWTTNLLTVARQSNGNSYTSTAIYDANGMPIRMGAEAAFVPVGNLSNSYYYNNTYNIFNYDVLPSGSTTLGYIYGGITCDSVQSSNTKPANATNAVYKVVFNKP